MLDSVGIKGKPPFPNPQEKGVGKDGSLICSLVSYGLQQSAIDYFIQAFRYCWVDVHSTMPRALPGRHM